MMHGGQMSQGMLLMHRGMWLIGVLIVLLPLAISALLKIPLPPRAPAMKSRLARVFLISAGVAAFGTVALVAVIGIRAGGAEPTGATLELGRAIYIRTIRKGQCENIEPGVAGEMKFLVHLFPFAV